MSVSRLWVFLLVAICLGLTSAPGLDEQPSPAVGAGSAVTSETDGASEAESVFVAGAPKAEVTRMPAREDGGPARVYVIPIRQEINMSALYILRRGLKEAIELQADMVILDMDTPGGALDVTLEMMQMLDRFKGHTATFVNENGLSAGAFISAATGQIFFSPAAVVGAAAPVSGGGQEIGASMREKILSMLKARVRAIAGDEAFRYRASVVTAMMDSNYLLRVEGKVLKESGQLLTLTASEAAQLFGNPPQPLFSSGTAESLDSLLDGLYGPGGWEKTELKVTWSIDLARLITSSAVVSLLLGAGLLCLYVEFKTPGFGFFGITGGILLGIVFFGHHVAGLSGHEASLLALVGLTLIAIELFVFPGTLVAGILGVLALLSGMVWALADVWPEVDGSGFDVDPGGLLQPLLTVIVGVVLSFAGLAVLWRFLPKTKFYGELVLETGVSGAAPGTLTGERPRPALGSVGKTIGDLRPRGEVEVQGQRYEAVAPTGWIPAGTPVKVAGYAAYELKVEACQNNPASGRTS